MSPRVHKPAFSISIPRLSPQSMTGPSAGARRRLHTATSERGARAAARPGAETKPAAVGPCPEVLMRGATGNSLVRLPRRGSVGVGREMSADKVPWLTEQMRTRKAMAGRRPWCTMAPELKGVTAEIRLGRSPHGRGRRGSRSPLDQQRLLIGTASTVFESAKQEENDRPRKRKHATRTLDRLWGLCLPKG